MTIEEVQLGPGDDRLQSLSNDDFLAPTNNKKLVSLCNYFISSIFACVKRYEV